MEQYGDYLGMIMGAAVLVGILQCFFAYRMLNFWLGLTGLVFGAMLLGAVGGQLSSGSGWIVALAALVGAVVGVKVALALRPVGIFLIGAAFVGGMVASFCSVYVDHIGLLVGSALAGGVLALLFAKHFIILTGAWDGAWAVTLGVFYFLPGNTLAVQLRTLGTAPAALRSGALPTGQMAAFAAGGLLLTALGAVVQYRSLPAKESVRWKQSE